MDPGEDARFDVLGAKSSINLINLHQTQIGIYCCKINRLWEISTFAGFPQTPGITRMKQNRSCRPVFISMTVVCIVRVVGSWT
jgi:hypothetical protein